MPLKRINKVGLGIYRTQIRSSEHNIVAISGRDLISRDTRFVIGLFQIWVRQKVIKATISTCHVPSLTWTCSFLCPFLLLHLPLLFLGWKAWPLLWTTPSGAYKQSKKKRDKGTTLSIWPEYLAPSNRQPYFKTNFVFGESSLNFRPYIFPPLSPFRHFPRLSPVTCFPALITHYILSRPCQRFRFMQANQICALHH